MRAGEEFPKHVRFWHLADIPRVALQTRGLSGGAAQLVLVSGSADRRATCTQGTDRFANYWNVTEEAGGSVLHSNILQPLHGQSHKGVQPEHLLIVVVLYRFKIVVFDKSCLGAGVD